MIQNSGEMTNLEKLSIFSKRPRSSDDRYNLLIRQGDIDCQSHSSLGLIFARDNSVPQV